MAKTTRNVDYTMEDLQKHSLRLDLDSIKEGGYGKEWARKYLIDRYIAREDSYITEDAFDKILNEIYKERI